MAEGNEHQIGILDNLRKRQQPYQYIQLQKKKPALQ